MAKRWDALIVMPILCKHCNSLNLVAPLLQDMLKTADTWWYNFPFSSITSWGTLQTIAFRSDDLFKYTSFVQRDFHGCGFWASRMSGFDAFDESLIESLVSSLLLGYFLNIHRIMFSVNGLKQPLNTANKSFERIKRLYTDLIKYDLIWMYLPLLTMGASCS